MSLWYIWLIAAALLLILEMLSGFVATFCLAVGCLAAMIVDLCGGSVSAQMWTALIGTIVTFFGFAPVLKRWHQKKVASMGGYSSNMDALIGRRVEITEPIAAGATGRVTIDGDSWQVRCLLPHALEAGSHVKVVGHESIVLIVAPEK